MVHSLIALHSDLVQAASTTACTLRSLNPVFQKWVFRPSRVRQPQWLAIAFALLSFALFARSPVVRSSARYHSLSRFSVASRNCQDFRIDRPRRSTGAFARLSYRRCLTGDLSLGWPWRSCPPFLLAYPFTPTGILSAHGGSPRRCIVRTSHDVRSGRSVATATPVAGRQSGTPQPCGTPTGVLLGPGRSVGRPVHSGCCPFRCPLY